MALHLVNHAKAQSEGRPICVISRTYRGAAMSARALDRFT